MSEELGVEERARIMGHVPLDEFKGNPDKWVPAEQWVERAEQLFPINKAMVKKLTEDVSTLSQTVAATTTEKNALVEEIAGLKKTLVDFAEFSKKSEERAFKKALAEIEAKQRRAVVDGDAEAFDSAKAELDELKQHPAVTGIPAIEVKPVTEPAKQEGWPKVNDPAIFKAWTEDNDWYGEDPEMAAYAYQMDNWLANTKKFPTQREQLNQVTELVKKKFPKYWETKNPNQDKPPSVEGGSEGAAPVVGGRKKTYIDLTPAAKAYCDEWAGKDGKGGTIPGFTRDMYLDQADPSAFR
jgi:hypothetical protein